MIGDLLLVWLVTPEPIDPPPKLPADLRDLRFPVDLASFNVPFDFVGRSAAVDFGGRRTPFFLRLRGVFVGEVVCCWVGVRGVIEGGGEPGDTEGSLGGGV